MAWWAVWGTTIPLSVTLLHIQHPKSLLFAIGTTKAFLPNTCNHLCIPRPSSPELGVQSSRAPEPADSVMHSAGAALACPISQQRGPWPDFALSWLLAPGSRLAADHRAAHSLAPPDTAWPPCLSWLDLKGLQDPQPPACLSLSLALQFTLSCSQNSPRVACVYHWQRSNQSLLWSQGRGSVQLPNRPRLPFSAA